MGNENPDDAICVLFFSIDRHGAPRDRHSEVVRVDTVGISNTDVGSFWAILRENIRT